MPRSEVHVSYRILMQHFGPSGFTAAQAIAAGVSPRQLRSAVAAGVVTRRRHGHYTVERIDDADQSQSLPHEDELIRTLTCHVAALQELGHTPVIAGQTAAELWGIPVLGVSAAATPTILVQPVSHVRRGRRGGILLREGSIPADQVLSFKGLRVTSPLRTGVDLARLTTRTKRSALTALIGAARAHLDHAHGLDADAHLITRSASQASTRVEIVESLLGICLTTPRRGQALLKTVLPWVDPRIETPLESLSWFEMNSGILPMMTPQVEIAGASGRLFRVDFACDHVIGEADGALKYASSEVLWAEKQRQSDLEAAGFTIVRWTWAEIVNKPSAVAYRLLQALARGPARIPA